MKKKLILFFVANIFIQFILAQKINKPNASFNKILEEYAQERLSFFPLEATQNGDTKHNAELTFEFTDKFRHEVKNFYKKYLTKVQKFDAIKLNLNDKISYNVFVREMQMSLKGLSFKNNLAPLNQFYGMHLDIGQLGSGEGNQPFKTVEQYEQWIKRATLFNTWVDSAIVYFNKGIEQGYVLPKSLVIKIIPQCKNIISANPKESLFWGPIKKMPSAFTDIEKDELQKKFTILITTVLEPAYLKLANYFENIYLEKARVSSGISTLPTGKEYYNWLVQYWTTTNTPANEIFKTGLREVARIKAEMEKVKQQVGFKNSINEFFEFMKNDAQFMPFKTASEVIEAFKKIQTSINPNLPKYFSNTPKTKFEIRQTEAFRAASASAEYNQGSADGSRPGIFYIPIVDATKFNTTSGMESLFLHEAIPGHHYQISLQQENESLPAFRRFSWYGAYGEGWALYCESLGKELGLYKDPYQYMGALGDEMHRAIRLVVDVAIHTKNMTREQAIAYMMENEAISEEGATAEIERYMAIPAQALSYKTGSLKIKALREKYTKKLGKKFSLQNFHDELLKDGCLPLDVLENKMNDWSKKP